MLGPTQWWLEAVTSPRQSAWVWQPYSAWSHGATGVQGRVQHLQYRMQLVFVEPLLKWACNRTHRSVSEYSISPELLGKREAGNTAVFRHREEQVL